MAHNLARRADGKTAMAWVGDVPWHGLGQALTEGASIGVWKKEAGLDWVAREGIPRATQVKAVDWSEEIEFSDYKAIWRSDTRAPLAIVGSGYKIVQPGEVLEFFRKLVEFEGFHIHTAGCLYGGRKVWALATRKNSQSVDKGGKDVVQEHLLLTTSLDGSMRTMVVPTSIRVVCWNTLSMALNESGAMGRAIKISHRQHFDHDEVHAALGLRHNYFGEFMENAKRLADTPLKLDEANHLLSKIFQLDGKPRVATAWMGKLSDAAMPQDDEVDKPRGFQRVMELFQGEGKGSTLKTAKGTRWGLLNAVTEYVDHEMGRTDNSRLDSAWFGRGAQLKFQAHKAVTAA